MGFQGIDIRQTGERLLFRAFLQDSAGALVTAGTTTVKIYEAQSDGTLKSYDFNDNTFKTTALTTETLAMTHRQGNNSTTNTGLWTVGLATLSGFTAGNIYFALVNNSGASPTDQMREFQFGNASGSLNLYDSVDNRLSAIGLDHLVSAAAVGADITDNSIIAKLVSKSGTADWDSYDNTTDALEAISDKVVAASPQTHVATAHSVVTGTLDAGTFADTATVNTTYLQVSPVTPAVDGFGLNVELTFSVGTGTDRAPDSLSITGYFDAAALRTVQIWGYDASTATWVQLSTSINDFGNAAANETFQYSLTRNMIDITNGEVKIRATSTSTNTGDDWFWDQALVTSVAVEAAGLTADAIQQAVWSRNANGSHDENTVGYNLSKVHLLHGTIVSATSASQFILDDGSSNDAAYPGMLIVIEDNTDDHYETRRIKSYTGATKEVVLDKALSFTPEDGVDHYYIPNFSYGDVNTTHISGTAQTANDNGADLALITGTDGVLLASAATSATITAIKAVTDAIGATGSGLSAIPWNAAWDAEVESEVNDALNTAIAELAQGQPTATPTIRTALMLMYMALRNQLKTQTSGTDALEIYDDSGTLICKKLISDDGSDYTEAKMTSGA